MKTTFTAQVILSLAILGAIPVRAADPPPPYHGGPTSQTPINVTPGTPFTETFYLTTVVQNPEATIQSPCETTYTFGGSGIYTSIPGQFGVYIPGAITSSANPAKIVLPPGTQGEFAITYTLTELPIPPHVQAASFGYDLETYGTIDVGACANGFPYVGTAHAQIVFEGYSFVYTEPGPALPLECPQNNGPPTQVGDPCDVANREFVQSETDYSGAGLQFTRYYHSTTGIGWNHSYAANLVFSAGVPAVLVRPDGHYDGISSVNGEYISLSGAGIHVQASGANWIALIGDGSSEVYNASGQLIQEVSAAGQATTLTYNTAGLLTQITGPFGHTLTLAYDADNRLSSLTEPDGVSTVTYAYDGSNNLTSTTYPDGTVRSYQYQTQSGLLPQLTGIIDESGTQFVTVQYSASGAVSSSQDAGGANAVSIAYGTNSATVTDGLGGTTVYAFTTDTTVPPRVTSVTRNSLPPQTYVLPPASTDPQRRVTQYTDPNGNITTYSYDTNHLTSKTQASGAPQARTFSYQYLATTTALPTLVTEALRQTSYTYFSGTNLVQTKTVTDPATGISRTWSYTYDSYGRVLTAKGPRTDINSTTTYTYYTCTTGAQCGQAQTITDAVGNVTTFNTYNAHAQPLTITDPNGVVTTLTYDSRQRLTSRQVGSELTSFSYYPTGVLKQATLPDNSFYSYTYDGAHRLTQITDELGNKIAYVLDAMGNRTAENDYDPSGVLHRTHSRVINTLDQLYQDVNAAGTSAVTTAYGYDNNGNRTAVNAPLSRNTANAYDPLNRLIQITDPASGNTYFALDAEDDLTSVKDPRGLTTTYAYNGLGDLTSFVSPDTGTTTKTYDSAGNLATSTDARGATSTYSYDALNRPTTMAFSKGGVSDQTLTFTYDAGTNGKGHLTSASDANHSLTWAYDGLGRVISKKQMVGAVTLSTGYAYTNADLTTVTTPAGNTITYGYNSNHQIVSLALGTTTILAGATYEPLGPVNGWTWGNGTVTARTYNTDGYVSQIASAGTKIYAFDAASRITGITDSGNSALSWTYGYDALDRINSATATSVTQGFTYDANSNRLTQSGTTATSFTIAASSNQLATTTGALTRTYSYDAAGHVLAYGGPSLSYNNAGRLVSAVNGSTTTTYTYDALGERIAKSSAGTTTYFAYDLRGHLLGEYTSTGALIQEIVWLGDTPVASVRPTSCGLGIFYIHTDHLNTPRRITRRTTSDIVWRWDSDPFGDTAANQNPSGLGTFAFNLRFPGQYYDSETGQNYNVFRDYDSTVGRYVESDPMGLKGGTNTYGYVAGNPIGLFDVTGLQLGCFWGYYDSGWVLKHGSEYVADVAGPFTLSGEDMAGDLGEALQNVGACRWFVTWGYLATRTTRMEMWCPTFTKGPCGSLVISDYQKTNYTYDDQIQQKEFTKVETYTQPYVPAVGMCYPPTLKFPGLGP